MLGVMTQQDHYLIKCTGLLGLNHELNIHKRLAVIPYDCINWFHILDGYSCYCLRLLDVWMGLNNDCRCLPLMQYYETKHKRIQIFLDVLSLLFKNVVQRAC